MLQKYMSSFWLSCNTVCVGARNSWYGCLLLPLSEAWKESHCSAVSLFAQSIGSCGGWGGWDKGNKDARKKCRLPRNDYWYIAKCLQFFLCNILHLITQNKIPQFVVCNGSKSFCVVIFRCHQPKWTWDPSKKELRHVTCIQFLPTFFMWCLAIDYIK